MPQHRVVYSRLLLMVLCLFPLRSHSAAVDLTGEWRRTTDYCIPGQSITNRVWVSQTGPGFVAVMLTHEPCHPLGTVAFVAHETLDQYHPSPAWVAIGSRNAPSQAMVSAKWSLPDAQHLVLTTTTTTYTWERVSGPIGLGGAALGVSGLTVTCKNVATGQSLPGTVLAGNHVDCDALPAAPGEPVQMLLRGRAQ